MAIEKIRVSNFKSFKDLEMELGQFNVLIGANASGKSNFVQIFRFLRDIAKEGLDNAVSLGEGVEYLQNVMLASSQHMAFEITSKEEMGYSFLIPNGSQFRELEAVLDKVVYQFALTPETQGPGFKIVEDKLTRQGQFFEMIAGEEKELGQGVLLTSDITGELQSTLLVERGTKLEGIFDPLWPEMEKHFLKTLLLQNSSFFPPIPTFLFPSLGLIDALPIGIYDFDPKLSKTGIRSGRQELEENGSNLPIVLRKILENSEEKRAFMNLIRDLLPFVEDLAVDRMFDQSLSFRLQETYSQAYLPASLLSNGTINLVALIVALFFEEKPFVIIEEPERNIHPYLISRVVNMLKEASEKKQIIITTHSPEIVKYAGIENLLLISRDKEGFSTITRPKDKEMVKTFLEHDLGVDDLYVQNLLEV